MRLAEIQKKSQFRLHPALNPDDYQITSSLGDARNWKAKTLRANSDGEIGEWEDVGYVMIGLKDDTIVPIARNDEHRAGYDLMYWLAEKNRNLNPSDFYPIYVIGNNYVFNPEEIKPAQEAVRRFLSYGGKPSLTIEGTSQLDFYATMADFAHGDVTKAGENELAPFGKRLFDQLEKLAKAVRAAKNRSPKQAFSMTRRLLKFLEPQWDRLVEKKNWKLLRQVSDRLDEIEAQDDLTELEKLIFGFDVGFVGIKNAIHNGIRAVLRNDEEMWYSARMVRNYYGNLKLADQLFARI